MIRSLAIVVLALCELVGRMEKNEAKVGEMLFDDYLNIVVTNHPNDVFF